MFHFKKSASRVKSTRNFRPRGEALESRLNLAGNVLAYAFGPNLYLIGDDLDNELQITGNGKGVLSVVGAGTTVNGTAGAFNASGIYNIFAEMGNGNDGIQFLDVNIDGLLRFNGSNGNDELLFGNEGGSNYFGSVVALMGEGSDVINVVDDNFTAFYSFTAANGDGLNVTNLVPLFSLTLGATSITGGNLADFVSLGSLSGGTVTTGFISLSLGNGDNEFFLDGNATVTGGISMLGGSGPDNFEPGGMTGGNQLTVNGSITASLGDGLNFMEFTHRNNNITGVVSLISGNDADIFELDSTTFSALALSLTLGAGDNIVELDQGATTIRSSLTISTLGGLDTITGFGLDVFSSTYVSTGEGSDLILLDNSRFRSVVTVLTAGGNDRVNVENGTKNDGIGTRFDSIVSVYLGFDNDIVDIGSDADDFATFASSLIVDGSLGTDTLLNSPFNVFVFPPTFISFP